MRRARWLPYAVLVGCPAVCLPAAAQGTPGDPGPVAPAVQRLDPALDDIVASDAAMDVLAGGHGWTEGPLWVPALDGLLYSDIPADAVYLYREGEGSRPWIEPTEDYPGGSGGSNGLILDRAGGLLLAQHGDRRVARLETGWQDPAPIYGTLAATFNGRRFNSPNDLVLRHDGSLYFTDPPYGLAGGDGDPARELEVNGVYRLAPDGAVELLVTDLTRPNGVALSPDQSVLYVANSDPEQGVIMAYDLDRDGGVGEGRVFFESWGDGMAVDRAGNLFVAGPGNGVLVLSPAGVPLGSLRTGERTSNVAFGDDGSTLYITADSHLMRIRLKTKGWMR